VAEKGKTIFISTHQLDEAEELCDRVAILDEGKIKANGSPLELKAGLSQGCTLGDVFSHYTGKASLDEQSTPFPVNIPRQKSRGRGIGRRRGI